MSKHELEGQKERIHFFKDYVVEVKQVNKAIAGPQGTTATTSQISIYDFKNQITMYWNPPANGNIIDVQIEEGPSEGIYFIAENYEGQRVDRELVRLYPMDNNVKIYNLMKKSHYTEALTIAKEAGFPKDIQSEIIKEHADKLFQQKKYDEAIEQYMQTINFLNPSYVIQNYIQVTQLDNLIKYLEKLIRDDKASKHRGQSYIDYNKDYTALLLNCYVKKDKKAEIKDFLTIKREDEQPIFDVDTAIEVCR